jgi:hypothetical protein
MKLIASLSSKKNIAIVKCLCYLGLETSAIRRFVTGPAFIDTDKPICHPPEWQHNRESMFGVLNIQFRAVLPPWEA